ncbi:MAG: cupin domain-containing protein [Gammaproteobacteria bacterium]|nr:cupin domain-containing protein [Gammaproteobacteria bacterium]
MNEDINPLGDLTPESFLADYWQQRPLVVRQAFPGFQSPISAEELAGLSCEADVDSRIVIEKGGEHPWQTFYGPMDEAVFQGLPDTHWSLLVNDVEKHLPQLAWLLDCFRFIPEWCIDDLMISYAPEGGSVGPHLDRYDVFILQAQGHRHWQIHSRDVAADNRVPGTDMDIQKEFEAEQDWLLGPGDMIYIPPGVSHYGVATDDCLSFSIGFRAPSHAEMLQDFVGFISQGRPAEVNFSDPQLSVQQHANEITATTLDSVREVLGKYLQADPPGLSRWFGCFISDVKTDITPEVGQAVADFSNLLVTHSVLARHPASHYAFSREGQRALLFVDGDDFDVSVGFAETLCAHREIELRTLAAIMTDAEQQLLLNLFNTGKLSPSL